LPGHRWRYACGQPDDDFLSLIRDNYDNQQIYLNEVGQYQMPEYYKWSWPFLHITVIGLPLVVYALCYSVIAMVVWVSRGFKPA